MEADIAKISSESALAEKESHGLSQNPAEAPGADTRTVMNPEARQRIAGDEAYKC